MLFNPVCIYLLRRMPSHVGRVVHRVVGPHSLRIGVPIVKMIYTYIYAVGTGSPPKNEKITSRANKMPAKQRYNPKKQ